MATKTATTEIINIRPVEMRQLVVTIQGDTPLIVHAWSEKAKRMMLEAQQKKSKGKAKEIRNPVAEFIDSMYWLTPKPNTDGLSEEECEAAFSAAISAGAKFGFPAIAIKKAGNSVAYRTGDVKNQMGLRCAYGVLGENNSEFIEILTDEPPIMREDMVKIGMGTADLRYRGEFRNWSARFILKYDANGQYSLENIINTINKGGMLNGIGEWRPERDGISGTYHVVTAD